MLWLTYLLVLRTEHHLSSFKCGFLNIFRARTCCVVCHAYCFCYVRTKMARKNVWKSPFIRLLRWFNFSQSGSRKNNRKALEGASMEPTNTTKIKCCNSPFAQAKVLQPRLFSRLAQRLKQSTFKRRTIHLSHTFFHLIKPNVNKHCGEKSNTGTLFRCTVS